MARLTDEQRQILAQGSGGRMGRGGGMADNASLVQGSNQRAIDLAVRNVQRGRHPISNSIRVTSEGHWTMNG